MTDEEKQDLLALRERYAAAAHKMQSGVALLMERDPGDTTPKHLRVGVNSAMVDAAGLAQLLIDKGIVTRREYFAAIAAAMEREADRYEREVQALYGPLATIR